MQGVVIGTPYYMAPEQMRNEVLDGRADQFSWGVVAYELLAGKPPWTVGRDALQLVSEVLSKRPSPPTSLNPEIPHDVEAIVMRALAKSPDERFPSMTAIVEALSPAGVASLRSLPPQTSPLARTESFVPGAPSGPISLGVPTSLGAGPAATGPTGEAKKGGWARWGLVLAVLSAVVLLAGTTYRRRAEPGQAAPAQSGAAAPSAQDPSTGTKVPAAASAYRAAMTALRDADMERGTKELDDAIRADPLFAAAHLRYALTRVPPGETERRHLQDATRLRGSLDAHDQVLVNAFAPVASLPGDLVEVEKRLADAVARSPNDADFTLQLCQVRGSLERADAIDTCRRASELDPGAATPLRRLALAQVHADDVRGALASFEACVRDFPLATSCLSPLFQLQALEGDCDAAITSARRIVSADPESAASYDTLAEALLGAGQPLESVRDALEEKHSRLPPSEAPLSKTADEALLALRTGDFVRADQGLRAWDDAVSTSHAVEDHYLVSAYRILLALEEGRIKEADALASSYLARQPAWRTEGEDDSIFFDGISTGLAQSRGRTSSSGVRSGSPQRRHGRERTSWGSRGSRRTPSLR